MAEDVKSFHGPLSEQVRDRTVACCEGMLGRLLDVGCGNGLLFEALEQVTDAHLYGVDRSTELLTDVGRRLAGRVGCARGMIDSLPFQEDSFDAVTCLNTLLNLPRLEVVRSALGEMMRVSNGKVIVDIRNGDNPLLRAKYWWHRRNATFATVAYRLRDISEIFETGGFKMLHAYPIGRDSKMMAWGYVVVAGKAG